MSEPVTLKWGELQTKNELSKVIKRHIHGREGQYKLDVDRLKSYVSGTIYAGQWSPVDMEGVGSLILPHGVVYEGQLKDGMCHGKGVLIYPMGQMVIGEWYEGEITSWTFKYKNIDQSSLATYCKQPDRRFLVTLTSELLPAGQEHLTNEQPTREIPEGCYDVVDGFYNPKTLWVHSSKNMSRVLYMPAPRRIPVDLSIFKDDGTQFIKKVPFVPIYRTSDWIKDTCRKAWDATTGYKPELYEYWFTGRKAQEERLNMRVEQLGGRFIWNESVCDEMLRYFEIVADNQKRMREENIRQENIRMNWIQEEHEDADEMKSSDEQGKNVEENKLHEDSKGREEEEGGKVSAEDDYEDRRKSVKSIMTDVAGEKQENEDE